MVYSKSFCDMMAAAKKVLALDYGAGSMRSIEGIFDGSRLGYREMLRCKNELVRVKDNLYWDIGVMHRFAVESIGRTSADSMGIDTWGADFGMLDGHGRLLFLPRTYRDPQVQEFAEEVFSVISGYELFESNGTVIEDICPLVHLCYWKKYAPYWFEKTRTIQLMANLICYLLTGEVTFDNTLASPSGMYSLKWDDWNMELMEHLGLPNVLPQTTERNDILGVAGIPEGKRIPVMRVCGHDTSSALMAVPAHCVERALYVSTGSWVMTGCFLQEPVITREAFEAGLSNENGFDGEINFLKYSNGLFIVQECAREWKTGGWEMDYGFLEKGAKEAEYGGSIDPDSPEFTKPGKMCQKILGYLERTGQPQPKGKAEIYAAVLNGIANSVAKTMRDIIRILGKTFDSIYVLGGGAKSAYLCNAIKRKTGLKLYAGPVEATAMGNICTQLIRQKELLNRSEAANLLRGSTKIREF
ncbi:hypothetical protein H8S18_12935 [Christensenella sp. NSJ-35]|uniref:Rhamnulokinase n=1 Tax=Christensenella tenuis TaxID=2763033 RepID=A0ABR7EHJ3_9FIRM|nr:hypothetical protein [Christensenella tenuis]